MHLLLLLFARVHGLFIANVTLEDSLAGLEHFLAIHKLLVGFSCLLLHDEGCQWVKNVFVDLGRAHSEKLCSVDAR